jgi:hypothetical protein
LTSTTTSVARIARIAVVIAQIGAGTAQKRRRISLHLPPWNVVNPLIQKAGMRNA